METIKEAIESAKKFSMPIDEHGQVFEYNLPELLHLLSLVAEEFWDKGHWQAQNNQLSNSFNYQWNRFTDNLKEK